MASIERTKLVLANLERQKGSEALGTILDRVGVKSLSDLRQADCDKALVLAGHPELASGNMVCIADDSATPPTLGAIAKTTTTTGEAMNKMSAAVFDRERKKFEVMNNLPPK